MHTNLSWKSKLLSNTYQIYSKDNLVGSFKTSIFSETTTAELRGEQCSFRTKGIWKQYTEIVSADGTVVGKITYNNWKVAATVSLHDKVLYCKTKNIWATKWSISDNESRLVTYSGSSSGQIEANTADMLLLMSGLQIIYYYWKTAILICAVPFIPIIILQ